MQDRIKTIIQAITEAQEAAKGEEKSSAGDKYETQRAMAHLNSEMNARQLQAAKDELAALLTLNVASLYNRVTTGAVVVCREPAHAAARTDESVGRDGHTYFIALGLGRTVINGEKITLLSPQSPLAVLLQGKQAGDAFVVNDNQQEVVEVF